LCEALPDDDTAGRPNAKTWSELVAIGALCHSTAVNRIGRAGSIRLTAERLTGYGG
jgi:hypothetical protein